MFDCIIIGAGPGGIVCTKELIENGISNILCLDKAPSLGGTFSNTYDSLTLTSSAVMSMFSDYWVGDNYVHSVWTKNEAVAYWQAYADHFGVTQKIQFNTTVEAIHTVDKNTWELNTNTGEKFFTKRLVMATGNNSIPQYPEWVEKIDRKRIDVIHSQDFTNTDAYRNKRVLVVGGGESGTDIALEISKVAKQCWVSLRNSTGWVTPRKRGDLPADIATHRGLWGLPRAYGIHLTKALIQIEKNRNNPVSDAAVLLNKKVNSRLGVFGSYGTKSFALPIAMTEFGCKLVNDALEINDGGRQIITHGGDALNNIDAIVFCTGYTNRNHLLPAELQSTKPRSLYKHMLHPDFGSRLAWIGWARPNFGSQFPIMEMQSRLFAQICKGACELPKKEIMQQQIAQSKAQFEHQFEHSAQRVSSLVDYQLFMDDLAKELKCMPPSWHYFFFYHNIWRKIMFGALQGTQFRLNGLGKKTKEAQEILSKCTHLPLNHNLVKLGIKGRIIYTLKKIFRLSIH
jgi:dimethylaniline monooxygenase (N-oxide forming)